MREEGLAEVLTYRGNRGGGRGQNTTVVGTLDAVGASLALDEGQNDGRIGKLFARKRWRTGGVGTGRLALKWGRWETMDHVFSG